MQLRAACWLARAALIGGLAACSAGGENTPESVLVGGGSAGAEAAASSDAGEPNPNAAGGTGGAGSMFSGTAGAGAVGPGASAPRDAGLSPTETGVSDAGDAGASDGADASISPELVAQLARLSALSARLAPLAERTASFWLEHGPDTVAGGFHATLDRAGNPIAPEDKGLIQQTRQLWMLSTWYERRASTAAQRALAERQYAFVRDSYVDAADGAFVYKVNRDGSRVVDARKQLMAESYAIYGLATFGRVFSNAEATSLALARFQSIDQSRHDVTNGGYDQRGDPGELPAGAAKDTNTHLHLLEAFTALYEATRDPIVGARLGELVDLFATRLLQPSGYVHAAFALDWAPFGAPRVSYGLDLETAWLVLEAARVLGRGADPTVTAATLAIVQHSAERGLDAQNGGYFEAGVPGGAPNDLDKIWWVQFEAMEGLWWAYALGADGSYLDRLESTLEWVERTEDRPSGEWFATTNADGSAVVGGDYKGDEWKESYHPVRALVYLQDWIDAERAALGAR
jgi:mannobiose 2-epimerase